MLRRLVLLVAVLSGSVLGSSGQCGHLGSLPDSCRCSFNSLIICNDFRNSTALDSLFTSIGADSVQWLDAVRLVNICTEAFAGLRGRVAQNVAKIQSFEIEDSQLSRLTDVWSDSFWNGHDGTFSLAVRRTSGLDTWNWSSLSVAFPSAQYLEIDHSPIPTLPDGFALAFEQLIGLTITNSNLMVIGQRALYCSMCKSIRLGFNDIQNIDISSIAIQEGSMLYLDLRNNSLITLPDGFFHNLAKVANLRVDLDGNPIEHLEANLFAPLLTLQRVDIRYSGGILRCDCALNYFAHKPFDMEHISCRKPPNFEPSISLEHFLRTCSAKQEF